MTEVIKSLNYTEAIFEKAFLKSISELLSVDNIFTLKNLAKLLIIMSIKSVRTFFEKNLNLETFFKVIDFLKQFISFREKKRTTSSSLFFRTRRSRREFISNYRNQNKYKLSELFV